MAPPAVGKKIYDVKKACLIAHLKDNLMLIHFYIGTIPLK
jgi:hypothetical protein